MATNANHTLDISGIPFMQLKMARQSKSVFPTSYFTFKFNGKNIVYLKKIIKYISISFVHLYIYTLYINNIRPIHTLYIPRVPYVSVLYHTSLPGREDPVVDLVGYSVQ